MRHLVALAGLTVGLLSPLTFTAPAYAVGETCEGLPATIVGSLGVPLHGTAGDDVIVSNGASSVFGGSGNDTICTTGSTHFVLVEGGAGDNFVDRRGDLDPAADSLVYEANTFYGSDARDVVTMTTPNVVVTGGGNDYVTFGDTPVPFDQITGRIDLGPGDDQFVADGQNGPLEPPSIRSAGNPRLTVLGGRGEDHLTMLVFEPGRWTFDVPHGRLSSRNRTALAFDGFEDYSIGSLRDDAQVDFVGSRRGESFEETNHSSGGVRSVRMGGGADEILVFGCALCSSSRRGTIDGGPGRDLLKVAQHVAQYDGQKVTVDLSRHRLTIHEYRDYVTNLAAVEDVQVYSGGMVSITGDGRANDLRAWGCRRNVVRGGGGNDVLSYLGVFQLGPYRSPYPTPKTCKKRVVNVVADGGPGNDLLIGGRGADDLTGGPGHDTARARQGTDRCPEVEVRKGCERS